MFRVLTVLCTLTRIVSVMLTCIFMFERDMSYFTCRMNCRCFTSGGNRHTNMSTCVTNTSQGIIALMQIRLFVVCRRPVWSRRRLHTIVEATCGIVLQFLEIVVFCAFSRFAGQQDFRSLEQFTFVVDAVVQNAPCRFWVRSHAFDL